MLANPDPENGKDGENAENDSPQGGNAENDCPRSEAESTKDKSSRPDLTPLQKIIMNILVAISLIAIFLAMNPRLLHLRASPRGRFIACMSNQKNTSVALECYATDHDSKYPLHLKDLVPDYMKQIPTCQTANTDTYSSSYVCSKSMKDYTFYCTGNNHDRFVEMNYPQYNSRQGLVTGE